MRRSRSISRARRVSTGSGRDRRLPRRTAGRSCYSPRSAASASEQHFGVSVMRRTAGMADFGRHRDPGARQIRIDVEVLGGRRSMRHSTRCFTASKPIAPSRRASPTAPSTSSSRKVSSRRSTWTYSRLPGPYELRSRRRVMKASRSQPANEAAWSRAPIFCSIKGR